MTKPRQFQITCSCSAYAFPHRLGGGKCNGQSWAQHYRTRNTRACHECPALIDVTRPCEVETGAEALAECHAFIEAREAQADPRPFEVDVEPSWDACPYQPEPEPNLENKLDGSLYT